MSIRRGIVVATHPEDYSVDLVMADDGSRLVGVQVMTGNGSTRSGSVDLPKIPSKSDKWDVTKQTGQEVLAVVGAFGAHPIVLGFLYPQISQMLFSDPEFAIHRHQSDVTTTITGGGDWQWTHPSGTYVRVAEAPNKVSYEGKDFDKKLKFDRNTGKRLYIRVATPGDKAVITIDPDGTCKIELAKNLEVITKGKIDMKADGDVSIESKGKIDMKAVGNITLTTPASIVTNAPMVKTPSGKIVASVDVIGGGISLLTHVHGGVVSGGDMTSAPAGGGPSPDPEDPS